MSDAERSARKRTSRHNAAKRKSAWRYRSRGAVGRLKRKENEMSAIDDALDFEDNNTIDSGVSVSAARAEKYVKMLTKTEFERWKILVLYCKAGLSSINVGGKNISLIKTGLTITQKMRAASNKQPGAVSQRIKLSTRAVSGHFLQHGLA